MTSIVEQIAPHLGQVSARLDPNSESSGAAWRRYSALLQTPKLKPKQQAELVTLCRRLDIDAETLALHALALSEAARLAGLIKAAKGATAILKQLESDFRAAEIIFGEAQIARQEAADDYLQQSQVQRTLASNSLTAVHQIHGLQAEFHQLFGVNAPTAVAIASVQLPAAVQNAMLETTDN